MTQLRLLSPATVRELLALQGYSPGTPPDLTLQAEAIDRQAVAAARCPNCRKRSLQYSPYYRALDDRYRVLGICEGCQAEEEF